MQSNEPMLDSIFSGKAFGEVINERLQSTEGEFFSIVGGLKSDFLNQVQEFQVNSIYLCTQLVFSMIVMEYCREWINGFDLMHRFIFMINI